MLSANTLEQPAIEFLATDLFGIVQTGSRIIPTLKVYFYGSPLPSFQSGKNLSALFGQALVSQDTGWVYLDSAGDELSFSGNTATLTSFTMGVYVYNENTNADLLLAIVPHNNGNNDPLSSYTNVRVFTMAQFGSQNWRFYQTNSGGTSAQGLIACSAVTLGWHHFVYVYDAATNQLKTFMDGNLCTTLTIWSSSCCSTGAYVSLHEMHLFLQ